MINRIVTMLRSGRVTLVDDSGPVQRVQIDEGSLGAVGGRRILDKVMKLGHFGFASIPPIGSEALLAAPNGERTHTMVIGTNHQPSRPRDMKPGDAAMYDVRGAKIELTDSGLVIDCAGLPAVIRNFSSPPRRGRHSRYRRRHQPRRRHAGEPQRIARRLCRSQASRVGYRQPDRRVGPSRLMSDIQILWDIGQGSGDWYFPPQVDGLITDENGASIVSSDEAPMNDGIAFFGTSGGLLTGNDLGTAVMISLFTDAEAGPDDIIPDGTSDRRGWWAGPIGSKLWLLSRSKQTATVLALAKTYIAEALQWLLDDGVASEVLIITEFTRPGLLGAQITIKRDGKKPETLNFEWAWQEI